MHIFCIAGPTATGKSDLAAEVAVRLATEIVSADAFQIYEGFDVLAGKPDVATLRKVPHHLIGTVQINEEMSAARYRALALPVIADISSRGRLPVLVGGSGLYIKALTHGLAEVPAASARLRKRLNEMSTDELLRRLTTLDPESAKRVDAKNRRRLIRTIEICLVSGKVASAQRTQWSTSGDVPIAESTVGRSRGPGRDRPSLADPAVPNLPALEHRGVFVFRDRDELYQRIDDRVQAMFDSGAIEEVRDSKELSPTVEQMIGIRDIRKHLAGEISRAECLARIQQLTRRYAKRQLTWFRRQTNLEPLNLSLLSNNEAVLRVLRRAIVGRVVND